MQNCGHLRPGPIVLGHEIAVRTLNESSAFLTGYHQIHFIAPGFFAAVDVVRTLGDGRQQRVGDALHLFVALFFMLGLLPEIPVGQM